MPHNRTTISIVLLLAAVDAYLWSGIFLAHPYGVFVLDVGQGDSALFVSKDDARILIDAGPDGSAVRELDRVLAGEDKRIDLAILTHPQLDHFGGLRAIAQRYQIGGVLVNGRAADETGDGSPWKALMQTLRERNVPITVLDQNDRIKFAGGSMEVMSPDTQLLSSGDLNDTGLVLLLDDDNWRMLFTSDIGGGAETALTDRYNIRADALKVSHHGSKFSTSDAFLKEVSPLIATISVGRGNGFGHPALETLDRLERNGASVFRTDTQGGIRIFRQDEHLRVEATR